MAASGKIWKAAKITGAVGLCVFGASMVIGDDVAVAMRTGVYGMSYGVGVTAGTIEEVGPGLRHGFNAAEASSTVTDGYLASQKKAAEKAAGDVAKAAEKANPGITDR